MGKNILLDEMQVENAQELDSRGLDARLLETGTVRLVESNGVLEPLVYYVA
jgi:hypothetical protein